MELSRNRRKPSWLAFVLAAALGLIPTATHAINVFLDYANFTTRLGELTTNAGVDAFSAGEVTSIRSNILSSVQTAYNAFDDITFTELNPGGSFETVNFGLTAGAGSLGLADGIDYRNQSATDVARVFTGNFGFILDEFTGSTNRATQITQLSAALAGTGAHELGHNLGLIHRDAYGDITFTGLAGSVNTGGVQNTRIMATGTTGLNEAERETARTFSDISLAKLDFAADLATAGPMGTTAEQGSAHGTTGTAQGVTLTSLLASGLLGANIIGSIADGAESDFYSFSGIADEVLSLNIMGQVLANGVDTIITLFAPDGTTILGSRDDVNYLGDTYGGLNFRSFDSIVLNVPIPNTGTYFARVESFGTGTGDYELLITMSDALVPEPGTGLLLATGLLILGYHTVRRRYGNGCDA